MKKIKIAPVILLTISVTLLGGCRDFLDIKPKGRDVAQYIEHYNGLLNSTSCTNFDYNMQTANGTVASSIPYWPMCGDELITDQSVVGNMSFAEKNAFKWEADIFEPDDYPLEYGGFYQQIYIFNLVANGVMDALDGTQEERRQILAEARVARAYCYMMLAQFFGKPYNEATASTDLCVPLVLEASTGVAAYTRATVKEIYDFLLHELEEACPDLSEYTLHRQRIYRAAGYAILGRAYMLVYDYAKATVAFDQAEALMAKSSIRIELFDYHTEMTDWKASDMWTYGFGYPTNYTIDNFEIVLNRNVMVSLGGMLSRAKAYIKPEYMALFTEGDLRREFYTLNNGTYSNYRKDYRTIHNEGVDLPSFYLMYAECLARTNNVTKARELVSELRRNRFEPGFGAIPSNVTSGEDLIRFIVEERLREYMATGHRWFDMRRLWNDPLFQDLKSNYTHFDGIVTYTLTEDRLVFRIPPSVLIHNQGWKDND